jgi:hypothetical protein
MDLAWVIGQPFDGELQHGVSIGIQVSSLNPYSFIWGNPILFQSDTLTGPEIQFTHVQHASVRQFMLMSNCKHASAGFAAEDLCPIRRPH